MGNEWHCASPYPLIIHTHFHYMTFTWRHECRLYQKSLPLILGSGGGVGWGCFFRVNLSVMGRHEQGQEQSPCLQQFSFSFTAPLALFRLTSRHKRVSLRRLHYFPVICKLGTNLRGNYCLLGEVLWGSDEARAEMNRGESWGAS